jgi:hypothetical protein
MTFSGFRTAIDILKNRMPGALAMLKAHETGISIHSRDDRYWCTVSFYFDRDQQSCSSAYRSIERLYEMDRNQRAPKGYPLSSNHQTSTGE